MSHGDVVTIGLSNFFVKGSKQTEVKLFSHGLTPQHTKYIWENKKNNKRQQ